MGLISVGAVGAGPSVMEQWSVLLAALKLLSLKLSSLKLLLLEELTVFELLVLKKLASLVLEPWELGRRL